MDFAFHLRKHLSGFTKNFFSTTRTTHRVSKHVMEISAKDVTRSLSNFRHGDNNKRHDRISTHLALRHFNSRAISFVSQKFSFEFSPRRCLLEGGITNSVTFREFSSV